MAQRLEAIDSQGRISRGDDKYDWDDGSDHDDVANIYVRCDPESIMYIRFGYIKSGQPEYKPFHGETFLGLLQSFEIDHKNDEQLESVEGYYEPTSKGIVGLQFKTNLRISALIGYAKSGSTKFSLAVDGKKIIGFHGSSRIQLYSLGAYLTWIAPTIMEAKGGKGGKEWNDGAEHEGVAKITVRGGSGGIHFIKFNYVKDGQIIDGTVHGVSGGGYTQEIEINYLDKEYLVSVQGYYDEGDPGVIQGIQFKTNFKTTELMGENKGRKFSLAAKGMKIIGFHGYADKNLNSLGAYFTTSPFTKFEYKGCTFSGELWDDGTFDGVRKVYVTYNNTLNTVRCVKFDYDNKGKVERRDHGSMENLQEGEFVVDYPNEIITCVEVSTMKVHTYQVVASLTFKTSKGRTSTFGNATNSKFVFESKGCGLVGFHGRSSGTLYALGAYFRTLPPPPEAEKIEAKGGDGGASWDDGDFDGIRSIYIGHSKKGIAFVKFLYDRDNQVVVRDDHGSKTLLELDEFEFKYPCEYLISVEGSYDVVDHGSGSKVILMLRFVTNMRTSQVFGLETMTSFILEKEGHKIVGFHGKVGNMLHQIGAYVLPITD